jgi:hypothetical protein
MFFGGHAGSHICFQRHNEGRQARTPLPVCLSLSCLSVCLCLSPTPPTHTISDLKAHLSIIFRQGKMRVKHFWPTERNAVRRSSLVVTIVAQVEEFVVAPHIVKSAGQGNNGVNI